MKLERLTLQLLSENCYLYHNGKECAVFDPGSDSKGIINVMNEKGLKASVILLTHCHFDHIGAVSGLAEYFNAPVMCHEADNVFLNDDFANAYGITVNIPKIDKYFTDNEIVDFFGDEIKVIHTPGHTPGSVCFYMQRDNIIISGDTLFLESIGRTDLPYGNFDDIKKSVKNKLYSLPDDVTVYPGHGFHTSIGHEKKFNPFIV